MNPGMIAGAAMGGVNSLMKLGMGIKQLIDGKKIQRKLDAQGRPLETTPQAFTEMEGLVRSQYLDPRLMGETEMKEQIRAQGANQIQNITQTAGSGVDALMAYNLANNNTNSQLLNVDLQSAQQRMNDYRQFLDVLGQKAQLQQSQFQSNVMQPYMEKAAQAQALKQSGLTNMSNAFNDAGNIAMGIGQMKYSQDQEANKAELLKRLFGSQGIMPGVGKSRGLTPAVGGFRAKATEAPQTWG